MFLLYIDIPEDPAFGTGGKPHFQIQIALSRTNVLQNPKQIKISIYSSIKSRLKLDYRTYD